MLRLPRPALRGCAQAAVALLAVALWTGPLHAETARGVNPADNLTKLELLPKLAVLDDAGGISVSTLTFKYDRAIRGNFGFNTELPIGRFESPFGSDNGLGDLNLRVRAQGNAGVLTGIAGLEVVVPTATASTLGFGKYMLDPIVAGVVPFSKQVFLAVIAKHFFSVAGAADRADIVQGQYRALLAYTAPGGWWLLADPQLWVDYEAGGRSEFLLEGEAGTMVGPMAGAWLRAGGHAGGAWVRQDWGVSGGLRIIML